MATVQSHVAPPTLTVGPLRPGLGAQLLTAAALVALADVLFFGKSIGISLVLFLLVVAAAAACLNPVRIGRSGLWKASFLLAAGMLPLVDNASFLSVSIAVLAMLVSVRMMAEPRNLSWSELAWNAVRPLLVSPCTLFSDLARAERWRKKRKGARGFGATLIGWAIPLSLGGIFAGLFVLANPLLDAWASAISFRNILGVLFSTRCLFWAALLCLLWPLLRLKRQHSQLSNPDAGKTPHNISVEVEFLFDNMIVRRCLVLFNVLFATQTVMDALYLWGGVTLPDGMSYAAYAHRGAYPLVVTALLAAAFVLVAMRPSGPASRDPLILPLVLAWVAQNILLTLSALLRLDLYVETYSLTGWRIAAFIWMLLVVVGLGLIVVQLTMGRSLQWLLTANALALAGTLYAYSFVNTPAVVANYNFRHSYEMRDSGPPLDIQYLRSLGPHALQAIDRYIPRIEARDLERGEKALWQQRLASLEQLRKDLMNKHLQEQSDWRAWSVSDWRLTRYLVNNPPPKHGVAPLAPDTPGRGVY